MAAGGSIHTSHSSQAAQRDGGSLATLASYLQLPEDEVVMYL